MPHPVPLISLRGHQQNEPHCFHSLFFSVAFSCSFLKCTGAFSCLGFNPFDSPPATQQVPPGCPTGNPCQLPGQFIPPFPRDLSSSQETTDICSLAAIPMSFQEVQASWLPLRNHSHELRLPFLLLLSIGFWCQPLPGWADTSHRS